MRRSLKILDILQDSEDLNRIFTDWQFIPLPLVLLAWTDEDFRDDLLSDPTSTLQELLLDCPLHKVFCVLENDEHTRHLILPYRHPSTFSWSKQQVETQLRSEMHNTNNLDYGIPIPVIAHALTNPLYKKTLMVNPRQTLADEKYNLGSYDYFVHENTERTVHLMLPENKWSDTRLSARELEQRLLDDLKPKCLH
ncbi:MAG: Nitrile hydratase, alpha chain [Rickettsiales bacterium]|jgi:hypothetical protein|nr:Nitrile hydratase, alpha chain [Rickettsiales bacterium]